MSGIRSIKFRRAVSALFLLCLFAAAFAGCSPTSQSQTEVSSSGAGGQAQASYTIPPFAAPQWKGVNVKTASNASLDLSCVNDGYVGVKYPGSANAKLKMVYGDEKYYYDGVSQDGQPTFFPVQLGSGEYTFSLLTQVEGTTYANVLSATVTVTMSSEFAPFLLPSRYVNYTESSSCATLFKSLTKDCTTQTEVAAAVYKYIKENIKYDKDRAAQESQRTSGYYLPDLDQVLESKKGICFDYAALAAAMLRMGGIPTKMVFGYVSPSNVYHAWNMIYLEGEGWIAVQFYVDRDTWTVVDLTFAASSGDASVLKFIGDGANYTQLYVY